MISNESSLNLLEQTCPKWIVRIHGLALKGIKWKIPLWVLELEISSFEIWSHISMLPSEECKNQKRRWDAYWTKCQAVGISTCIQVKLKPEWLGWLHNPQNQCLGLSPADTIDLILGKFLEASGVYSAGLLFFLGHNASRRQPDLAWLLVSAGSFFMAFFRQIVLCLVTVAWITTKEDCGTSVSGEVWKKVCGKCRSGVAESPERIAGE